MVARNTRGRGIFFQSSLFLIFSSQRVEASYECDLVTDLRAFLRDSDWPCHHKSAARRGKIQAREWTKAGNQPESEFLWYEEIKTKYATLLVRANVAETIVLKTRII